MAEPPILRILPDRGWKRGRPWPCSLISWIEHPWMLLTLGFSSLPTGLIPSPLSCVCSGSGGRSSRVTFGVGEYFKCKFPLDKSWNLLPLMKGTSGESRVCRPARAERRPLPEGEGNHCLPFPLLLSPPRSPRSRANTCEITITVSRRRLHFPQPQLESSEVRAVGSAGNPAAFWVFGREGRITAALSVSPEWMFPSRRLGCC